MIKGRRKRLRRKALKRGGRLFKQKPKAVARLLEGPASGVLSDSPDICALRRRGIAALVRAGELSRREVVEAHAARIEEVNGAVNALVDLRARRGARRGRRGRRRPGAAGGPLDGVPVSIKENFDVAGMPTTAGIPSRAELAPERDELSVRRLREAGAIVLGKGNMPDLAIRWNTISSLHGVTRNPRDPGLTVGGSSGGEAAAVAAGMVPLGLGSDYGGSIRVPATWCGVLGFRPTTGMVAKAPELLPLDFPPSYDLMASTGPLARSVEDLELAFDVLRGPVHAGPGERAGRAAGRRRAARPGGAADRGDRRRGGPRGGGRGPRAAPRRSARPATPSRRAWCRTCAGRRSCSPRSWAPS